MSETHIDPPWWPPGLGERIGDQRAQELVASLGLIASPMVDAPEANLRHRANPGTEIVRSASSASSIARSHVDDPQGRSLCVGVAYEAHSGDAQQNSIQLGRDGVLRWRQE